MKDDVSRDWGGVDILRRLFLPTVNIYGGVPRWCFYGTSVPFGLSNVVATLRSHK
jgi:hypothetical protein